MYNLHVHSDYSNIKYLDSINKVEDIVKTSVECGLKGSALTDHETLSGHLVFLDAAKAVNKKGQELLEKGDTSEKAKIMAGFKPILGNEVYLTREGLTQETYEKGEKFYHFILLAKDKKGWQQLNELSSIAWDRYFVRAIPRTPLYISDIERVVGADPGHLIATTACLGGFLGRVIQDYSKGNIDKDDAQDMFESFSKRMKRIFGEDFYYELQPGQSEEQIFYNRNLVNWSKRLDIKLMVATDAHYNRPEWKEVHEAYLNSQEAERETGDFYDYTYIMSESEIRDFLATHLESDVITSAIYNTNQIGEKIDRFEIERSPIIPKIPFKDKEFWNESIHRYDNYEWFKVFSHSNDDNKFLLYKIIQGIDNMDSRGWLKPDLKTVLERVNLELEAIYKISEKLNQNMSTYFTTFQGIVDEIWKVSLLAPGRGSAGAFLINFLLEITQINPLTQPIDHPSWRFIAPDKASLPDIDIDVGSSKKKEVFQKLEEWFQSFGSDITYIATFGTEKSKSAIITAARGMGLDSEDGLYFASMVPSERGFLWSLSDCYFGDEDKGRKPIKDFVQEMDNNPEVWKVAQRIEGLINRRGVHPAGVAIFNDGEIFSQTSTMIAPGGQRTTQYDLESAERLGVVKYDLLATDAIDGIQTDLFLLVENGYMDWESDLKTTYNKNLHPEVLDYKTFGMWEKAHKKEVISLFQLN